jgi:hypothetical protein
MNRREAWALICDLRAGVRWWCDFGHGPQELRIEDLDGRHGIVFAWCPLEN